MTTQDNSLEVEEFDAEVALYSFPQYLAEKHPSGGVCIRQYPVGEEPEGVKVELLSLEQVIAFLEERLQMGSAVVAGGLQ